jgi:hypothetical protein
MKFSQADSRIKSEGFPTFRDLTLSLSSGSAGDFLEPKPISFGSNKPPQHLEDGDRVRYRNVVKPSHLDGAVCPRKIK